MICVIIFLAMSAIVAFINHAFNESVTIEEPMVLIKRATMTS